MIRPALLIGMITILFMACQDNDPIEQRTGKLVLKITDAPFPMDLVETAEITILKGEIWQEKKDSTVKITLFDDTVAVNLLELQNGVTEKLAEVELPQGDYRQVRLYLLDAFITISDQGRYDMKLPANSDNGLKLSVEPVLKVRDGMTAELLLDFDISRSFLLQGNANKSPGIKGFIFNPVIRGVNNSFAGRIQGFVRDTSNIFFENAEVWLERDTLMAKAFSDITGYYGVIGILPGKYELFCYVKGYDTLNMEISIMERRITELDLELTPLAAEE